MQLLGDAALTIPVSGQAGSASTTAAVRALAEAIHAAALADVVDIVP